MRRFLVSALACSLAGCADRPATAIVAAVAADHDTLAAVKSIRMRAYRGTELRHELILPPQTLDHPGTLTYRDRTDGDSKESLRFVIDGLSTPPPEPGRQPSYGNPGRAAPGLTPQAQIDAADPAVLVRRSARLPFVKEKSKLLRLGLSASCVGVPCEQATETCKAGRCVDDKEDPSALPDASGDLGGVDYGSFDDLPDGAGGAAGSGGVDCGGVSSNADVYVNARATNCSDDPSCGNIHGPHCSLGAALQSAQAKANVPNAPGVTIHLATTTQAEAYEGSIVLPAGVSLVGGYDGSTWSEPPTGTTTIRPAIRTSFVDDPISTANTTHVRSTIAVADSGGGDSVTLGNLVVELASDDVVTEAQAKLDDGAYLTAGIHLPGSAVAKLSKVTVTGKSGVVLNESTEGVYVSSGGSATVSLYGSTITPPASRFGDSSAVKIDVDASSSVYVCDSTLTGGMALTEGRSSVGLRAIGGTGVTIQGEGCSGVKGLPTTVAGGFASISQGVSLDAPTSLVILSGTKVLGLQPPDEPTWPGKVNEAAAVVFNPLHTSSVSIEGATLMGLEKSQTLGAPKDTVFYGLRAVSQQDQTPLSANFSLLLNRATLRGVGAMPTPNECDSAYGLSLIGPGVLTAANTAPRVSLVGGSVLGGEACRKRKGAEVANLDVSVGTDSGGKTTSFRGSGSTSLDCLEAVGLSVETTLADGTTVAGGQYEGGDGCEERVGLRAGGVHFIQGVTAAGAVSDAKAQRLVGVEVVEVPDGVFDGTTEVTASSMRGGRMEVLAHLPGDHLVYAVGLRLAIDHGAKVTGNDAISGCSDCQGSMFAAGVRVDRPGKNDVATIVIQDNKDIVGATFAKTGTLATEARVDGVLVQTFADDGNKALSGGAFGQNLNVLIGATGGSIQGNLSPSGSILPGATTGVTIHGSGVTVQGAAGKLQTVAAGDASDSSVGVRLCDEDAYSTTTVCDDGDTRVLHVQASGGAARLSAGVSARRVYSLVLDGLVAFPAGIAVNQEKSRGIWLRDRNTGIVANSYFFGLHPAAKVGNLEDRACSLELDGTGTPPPNSKLLFVHNACVAGGAGPFSIGLYMDETDVASKQIAVTIANNLLAVGDTASQAVAWLRSRTANVDQSMTPNSLTLSGNRLFASPKRFPLGMTTKGFNTFNYCFVDPITGYQLCDANQAQSVFSMFPTGSTNNDPQGSPPGDSPYTTIYDPTPWINGGQCAGLVISASPVQGTGSTSTDVLSRDFQGNKRDPSTGSVSRGPVVCKSGG